MKAMITVALLAALALVGGCGGSDEPQSSAAKQEQERESAFDPLVETMDRAKAVQQTVDQQAEELRRRVEEAEDGEPPKPAGQR
jgi:TolA-binding protein